MKIRKMTKDGDYSFGNNDFNFYSDRAEGVLQNVFTKLQLWKGEFYLFNEYGTPWQSLLGTKDKEMVEIELKNVILTTKGVKELTEFQMDINANTREVKIDIAINTIYGSIDGVFTLRS